MPVGICKNETLNGDNLQCVGPKQTSLRGTTRKVRSEEIVS